MPEPAESGHSFPGQVGAGHLNEETTSDDQAILSLGVVLRGPFASDDIEVFGLSLTATPSADGPTAGADKTVENETEIQNQNHLVEIVPPSGLSFAGSPSAGCSPAGVVKSAEGIAAPIPYSSLAASPSAVSPSAGADKTAEDMSLAVTPSAASPPAGADKTATHQDNPENLNPPLKRLKPALK